MPDYKKKKRFRSARKSDNDDRNFKINVKGNNVKDFSDSPRVIKGNKGKRVLKLKIFLSFLAFILVVILLSILIFPVGVLETFNNFTLSFGSGEYPIPINGSRVDNVALKNNYYYILSDLNLFCFSNSGKQINSINHGFSKPVLKTSNTRALIYDQGQRMVDIYTLKKKVLSESYKFDILCADVSDSGAFAVATLSDSYASSVGVYDKNGSSVFVWNSAKDVINAVALSPNGKKLAVSVVNAQNGELFSKVYMFNVKQTDAEKSFEYSGKTVYSLYANSKGFYIISGSSYDFVNWSKGERTENSSELRTDYFRTSSSGAIAVLNRDNDRSDNRIIVLSKKGEKKSEFTLNGIISDIRQKGSHIYVISDTKILIYDIKGKFVSSAKCSLDYRYLVPTGSRSVNIISDNEINNIYIK